MEIVRLHESWKVIDSEPGGLDPAALSRPGVDTSGWLDVPVPGDVNAALVASGRMPDPHFGDNARQCYWVSARDWWYRLEFDSRGPGAGTCLDLCLDGVDGHADLYLNGKLLAELRNAFRRYTFDVRHRLQADGPNVLLLHFHSIDKVLGGPREDEERGWMHRRTLMRKPQFSFGWDWALPLPSVGIAGPVRLERYSGPRIEDVSIRPFVSGRVDFRFVVNGAARDGDYSLKARVFGHGKDQEKTIHRPGHARTYTTLLIDDPKLWWPAGMGDQPLYDYRVDLLVDGEVYDSRCGRLGIRETRILEEPFTEDAGPGISFWIEINGQRVFCKGGNWVPIELWPALATEEQYRFYLQKTVEANFNMQRVWGGGLYEREVFYELCDELGIMVWQDFMFSSAGYPAEVLRGEIIAEAEYQIRRLRNHPCIVLWCGCNEDIYSWVYRGESAFGGGDDGMRDDAADLTPDEAMTAQRLRDDPQIYSMILRGTVSRLGLGVPYIESSPQSHDDAGNMPNSGNCHISCWKYALFSADNEPERFREHFEEVCSFDSEFAAQGPASVATMKKFLPEAHLWPPDDVWLFHIQTGHRRIPHHEQTLMIAGGLFGEMGDLQRYVKHGQAAHAEMIRAEFEYARRDRPNNGGTMMWMYNDCWPTANWSIIDYYRNPKPAYYAARRACATWLPIVFERKGRVEFFFSNDGSRDCAVDLTYGQAHIDGTTVWEKKVSLQCGPVSTVQFHEVARGTLDLETGDYLYVDAAVEGRALPCPTYFPGMWKNVPWPKPSIELEPIEQKETEDGWGTGILVHTDAYARFCHLIVPEKAGAHWIDDNFFDLRGGRTHEVKVESEGPFDVADVRAGTWHTEWP